MGEVAWTTGGEWRRFEYASFKHRDDLAVIDDVPTGDESIVILQPSTLSSEILDPRNDAAELGVLKTDVEEGIWCNATSPETPPSVSVWFLARSSSLCASFRCSPARSFSRTQGVKLKYPPQPKTPHHSTNSDA